MRYASECLHSDTSEKGNNRGQSFASVLRDVDFGLRIPGF